VGCQLTLDGAPDAAERALLDAWIALAESNAVGLVAKGRIGPLARGWTYAGGGLFQSDRRSERATRGALEALARPGGELTFTVVPEVSELRIGVDRDADGLFDRDELDRRSDPADASQPGLPGRRGSGFAPPGGAASDA
jgi:hypothetical protein